MKIPFLLAFVLTFPACAAPNSRVVYIKPYSAPLSFGQAPPPCKTVCTKEYHTCMATPPLVEAMQEYQTLSCYNEEKSCFDACDRDDIR